MIEQDFKKEIKKLKQILKNKYHPEKVILYGSVANGQITEDSDIDVLIIKKTNKNFWERMLELRKLVELSVPFEPLVLTPIELEERKRAGDFFIEEILEEGKIIYEKK